MTDNDEHTKVTSVLEATVLDYREKVVILHGLSKEQLEREMARLKERKHSTRASLSCWSGGIRNSSSSSSSEDEDGSEASKRVHTIHRKKPEKTWCVFIANANQYKPPQGKSQTFQLQTAYATV